MGDERGVLVGQKCAARVGRAVGVGRVAAVRPVAAVSSRPGVGRAAQKVVERWHLLEVRTLAAVNFVASYVRSGSPAIRWRHGQRDANANGAEGFLEPGVAEVSPFTTSSRDARGRTWPTQPASQGCR